MSHPESRERGATCCTLKDRQGTHDTHTHTHTHTCTWIHVQRRKLAQTRVPACMRLLHSNCNVVSCVCVCVTSVCVCSGDSGAHSPVHPPSHDTPPLQPLSDADKLVSLQMALKCSDLGHWAAPLQVRTHTGTQSSHMCNNSYGACRQTHTVCCVWHELDKQA